MTLVRRLGIMSAALVLAACSAVTPSVAPAHPSPSPVAAASPIPSAEASLPSESAAPPSPSPSQPAQPSGPPGGVYAATLSGKIQPAWAAMPELVYVPDEGAGVVAVIDPKTFKVIRKITVGSYPEHITPDWDGTALYVENMFSNSLTVLDPTTGKASGRTITVRYPYNLYFSPNGKVAIDVEDGLRGAPTADNGLRFYNRTTWKQVGYLPIPWAGADHLDFSADGSRLILSCEYTGQIVLVDVAKMTIVKSLHVGGSSTDVRLAPDGTRVFVANQIRNGIDVLDARTLAYIKFIPLGRGTHGLAMSRDATKLYVTNRLAGTMSVIDIATETLEATWNVGGTPDMIAVSPDGTQLWVSNRYGTTVSVINSATGAVIKSIAVGLHPHGLAYWPEPGRYSLGHNGNMR